MNVMDEHHILVFAGLEPADDLGAINRGIYDGFHAGGSIIDHRHIILRRLDVRSYWRAVADHNKAFPIMMPTTAPANGDRSRTAVMRSKKITAPPAQSRCRTRSRATRQN